MTVRPTEADLLDAAHSKVEPRYYALGQTDADRRIFLIFTIRKRMIRIISARDMSVKERKTYHAQGKAQADVQE
ncbi:MAG: BrnT family toxin [Nitrospira sp.]